MTDIKHQPILLVEDNEDDVFIFRRAYKQAQMNQPVQVAIDGQEAVDYLTGQGVYADRTSYPLPFLVLLDLKLPFKNGLEVLESIRAHPETRELCVTILTSSAEERDVLRAQELGAQAYLVKPPSSTALLNVIAAARARLSGAPAGEIPRIAGDLFADDGPMMRNSAR